jgi:flagellar protein FlbD
VIAVTCRNGEHYSVDPATIERVETDPDTVLHLVDGTKYVVALSFDEMLQTVRDHRARLLVEQQQLYGGVAEIARHRTELRVERRARSRDGDGAPPAPDDVED